MAITKNKLLQRLFAFIAAVLLMGAFMPSVSAFAAADYEFNIKNGGYYSGTVRLSATSSSTGAEMTFKQGSTDIPLRSGTPAATAHYVTTANTDNTYRAANYLRINGLDASFSSNGKNGVKIPESYLNDGVNVITIITGGIYGMSPVYDLEAAHGISTQGNKDDFTIQGFYLALGGGVEIDPSEITLIKAKAVGSAEHVRQTEPYNPMKAYWIGDGWPGADSWAGHTNPRLDIPFAVELKFNYNKPLVIAEADFNTTLLPDGQTAIDVYSGTEKVFTRTINIDNTAPSINVNLREGQTIKQNYKINASFTDSGSGLKTTKAYMNDREIILPYTADLAYGRYVMAFYAEDKAGNINYIFRQFTVGALASPEIRSTELSDSEFTVTTAETPASVQMYEAERLNVKAGYGSNNNYFQQSYENFGNYSVEQNDSIEKAEGKISNTVSNGTPYQSFEIDLKGKTGNVVVSFDGGVNSGEKFVVKAFNGLKNKWVDVAEGEGEEKISFVLNTVQFAVSGKIKFVITMKYLDAATDRMLWFTDPQYLTKFPDLNQYYYDVMQYCASEYTAGRAGYLVTTGDIVEDNLTSAVANVVAEQWSVANRAFGYVNEAGMPYGIVTGNHDTGNNLSALENDSYVKYFGTAFYNDKEWYGGSFDNNKSHYDLITIGGYDFLVMYLGHGTEATDDTTAWANSVIKAYSHRNVILATHAYLSADGTLDAASRASQIYENLVVPNKNVKFLLCGHNDGANLKKSTINGRDFYAFLSDYQFIENEHTGVDHIIGDTHGCNGEGYMREILIGYNSIKMNTFSPVVKNSILPYGNRDVVDVTLELDAPSRTVFTKSLSAAVLGSAIETTKENDKTYKGVYSGNNAVIAKIIDSDGDWNFSFAAGKVPSRISTPDEPVTGCASVNNVSKNIFFPLFALAALLLITKKSSKMSILLK